MNNSFSTTVNRGGVYIKNYKLPLSFFFSVLERQPCEIPYCLLLLYLKLSLYNFFIGIIALFYRKKLPLLAGKYLVLRRTISGISVWNFSALVLIRFLIFSGVVLRSGEAKEECGE